MFHVSRANLVGAVAGFLLYAALTTLLTHSSVQLSSHSPVLTLNHSLTHSLVIATDVDTASTTASLNHSDSTVTDSTPQSTPPLTASLTHSPEEMRQVSVAVSSAAGCSKSPEEDFCDAYAKKHNIIPLTTNVLHDKRHSSLKHEWLRHNCENFFKHKLICTRAVPHCINPTPLHTQPLIAILAATTTRRVKEPAIHKIALFTLLLPSLVRTLDCGFKYVYVMGYDISDPYYDTKRGLSEVSEWFSKEIEIPMSKHGITITLATVRVDNRLKKPGPVFLAMASHAYSLGAEFFYRVNDDTELRGHWPRAYTTALMKLPPPYGVIGPMSVTSNLVILTHDFVHRTHMEIMKNDYYPVELPDWWMDNWISRVYGSSRTLYSEDAVVMHHTYAHGQRYEVDRGNHKYLTTTLTRGRRLIRDWMKEHNVSAEEIKEFENDQSYKGTFKFTEIKKLNPQVK